VSAVDELLAGERRDPGCVFAASGAEFGDDDEAVWIGVDGILDDLVGDVRAVEVAGVDVIDVCCDGFAEDGEGGVHVAWWAEDVRAGELHGAIAHAMHGHGGAGECEGAAEF